MATRLTEGNSKSLGLKIDENLTWKRHIDEISKKVWAGISALRRIGSYNFCHYTMGQFSFKNAK
jgi:hypothetical protein